MRKLLALLILIAATTSFAAEQKYNVWKSSYIGQAALTTVFLTSGTIIFHVIQGSGTVANAGTSYFAVHSSTGSTFTSDASTRVWTSLDNSPGSISGIGYPFDILVSSPFITKQGGANISYEWDWFTAPVIGVQSAN